MADIMSILSTAYKSNVAVEYHRLIEIRSGRSIALPGRLER